jgi:hypothetical protein
VSSNIHNPKDRACLLASVQDLQDLVLTELDASGFAHRSSLLSLLQGGLDGRLIRPHGTDASLARLTVDELPNALKTWCRLDVG